MDSEDAEYKRLKWRCRRGMLELDMVLIPFFDENFASLDNLQQHAFVKLLDCEDPDLLVWFSRRTQPEDDELAGIVNTILSGIKAGS
ncbi:MAG TPA: succinate dehydrogenase assembly factor 2 [Pseudomonadales bacterium]|nr:succinate dehydrogenase assembly factor 2 [Pseudomonadales bacterium]